MTDLPVLNADPGELVSGRAVRIRPGHRRLQGQAPPRRAGGLGRAPAVAAIVHILAAFALMPVAGHPYDLAALSGPSSAWLRWGIPLFDHWKFGFDLSILAVGSQSLSFVLEHLGMSGAAALTVAWKLPVVLADLLVGAVLVDLGRQLRCQRPALMATLWLISPVPLWVSAGHGQIESLTILTVVLSLDLLLRRRPLLAGVVAGLGIGVEYLPALVAIVVVFWLNVAAIERREFYRFSAGCAVALAFCFGPLLSTPIGRASLIAGLSFSADAASHLGHAQVTNRIGSSLWAVFDLSPGPFWLAAASSMSLALMVVLAHKARSANSTLDRRRLGIVAAGGLLLCVTLFDPGALPQFSVLVLGALCLVGLCVDLSPAVIVIGPFLQLAAGLIFVYGGSFQSYWYDMWATTRASGWPFPQSLPAADAAARLGALVVAFGLLLVSLRLTGAGNSARRRTLVAGMSIAVGVLGSALLAIWSLQPAFWQGVGSQGPSTLADFPLITAFQPGKVSMGPDHQVITFSPLEVLAARKGTVPPSLKLTVTAPPFFAQTTAGTARSGRGAVQTLTIPGWPRSKTQVHSLWVSALLGRPAWRSQADVLDRVPALAVERHRLDRSVLRQQHRGGHQLRSRRDSRPPATRRLIISSGTTWVAPGWAVVTYAVPASMVSPRGRLTLGLRGNRHGADAIAWNGSPHERWVVVSLRSGSATVTIDGTPWRELVTLPRPTPSLWYQHAEETSIRGLPLTPGAGVSITGVVIGGQRGAIAGGGLAWPSPGVLDHTIDGTLLSALGIVDVITLLGGALVLGRWAAGTRMPHVRFGGNPQNPASREVDSEPWNLVAAARLAARIIRKGED